MVTTTISLTTAEKSVYPGMALAKSSVGIGLLITRKAYKRLSVERFFCARVMVGCMEALRSAVYLTSGKTNSVQSATFRLVSERGGHLNRYRKEALMPKPTHIIDAADTHTRLSTQLDALLSLLIAPEAVNGLPADKLSALMWLAHDLLTQIESAHTTLQEAAA